MPPAPIRYSPAVEHVDAGELETIDGLNATFDTILHTTAEDGHHAIRAVHAKAHGILQGTMTVRADLPMELAQGLFATPGDHRVYMRLSTNAGDILPDAIALPRGMAIKVLDATGDRLPGTPDSTNDSTQDFIMVNGDVFLAKTADKFLGNLKLLAGTTDKLEGTKKLMSTVLGGVNAALKTVGLQSTTLASLGGAPNVDPLGETYFSVTPFRYGDYIAKFSLVPVSPGLTALKGRKIETSDDPNAIRDTVRAEMIGTDAVWDFQVQLCRDLDKQPIEDPTVAWDADDAPFVTVATIHVAAQNSWDPAQVDAVDEAMRFSVWTGLAAHQPLGNINRARKASYEHSARFRADFNKCPIQEPH